LHLLATHYQLGLLYFPAAYAVNGFLYYCNNNNYNNNNNNYYYYYYYYYYYSLFFPEITLA